MAFLESTGYESAICNAVSLGGDADTMACIAGGIAEAFYGGVPKKIGAQVEARLSKELLNVLYRFESRYGFVRRGHRP
jgi:ADP-ribosylglycohydrolase